MGRDLMRMPHLLTGVALVSSLSMSAPCVARAQAGAATTLIEGTVARSDGAALPLARVNLRSHSDRLLTTTEVDSTGRFALPYAGVGEVIVEFTGAGVRSDEIELYLGPPDSHETAPHTIGIDARLAPTPAPDSIIAVRAIGDFNDFDVATGRPLTRAFDGTWSLAVPTRGDTLEYALIVHEAHGDVFGTDSRRAVFRAPEWFAAVIPARNGVATIHFDPRLLPATSVAGRVALRDTLSRTGRIAAVLGEMGVNTGRMLAALRQSAASGPAPSPKAIAALRRAAWDSVARRVESVIDRERDREVRSVRLLELMQIAGAGASVPASYGERTLRSIPLSSPLWALSEIGSLGLIDEAIRVAAGNGTHPVSFRSDRIAFFRFLAVTDTLLREQRDTSAREFLLMRAVGESSMAGDTAAANAYLTRMVADFPDADLTKTTLSEYGASRVLKVGNRIPDFRLRAVDDPSVIYTRSSLDGRAYLIDFWATWCAPCVAQIPVLASAYARYYDRGFELLSVSADEAPATVKAFQRRHAMPWRNAIMQGALDGPDARLFEIRFLPRAVLVDARGMIVAADADLRGSQLEQTLKRVLAER